MRLPWGARAIRYADMLLRRLGRRAAGGSFSTPKVSPFVGLFVTIVAALAAFAAPVVMLLIAQGERLAGIEARMDGIETGQAEMRGEISDLRDGLAATNEHLVRIETVQSEHGQRLTRIEAGLEAVETVQAEHGERLMRIESTQAEHGARLGRIESTQAEHGARLGRIEDGLEAVEAAQAGLEDGQTAMRGELSATNERLARVEGTVAGALGRGFPERMAQAPEAEAGADG